MLQMLSAGGDLPPLSQPAERISGWVVPSRPEFGDQQMNGIIYLVGLVVVVLAVLSLIGLA
jgi:hypothetical protein